VCPAPNTPRHREARPTRASGGLLKAGPAYTNPASENPSFCVLSPKQALATMKGASCIKQHPWRLLQASQREQGRGRGSYG